MPWTAPSGWTTTTGHVATQSELDTYVKNNLIFLGTPPSLRAFNSAAISLTNNTLTALTFDSERWKTDSGMHSNASLTSRLVATVTGKYLCFGAVSFASNATGYRQAALRKNGTTIYGSTTIPAVNGVATDLSVATEIDLAANDYVELCALQTSGGALNALQVSAYSPEAGITLVGQ